MSRYQQAVTKLRHWLDTHFDAKGRCVLGPDDVRFYSKAPYLLTMAGLRAKGARVAQRVHKHFLDEQGELIGPPTFSVDQRVYGMGWLALGATVVERYDLAERVANRLAELQDAQCGGIVLPDADAGEDVAEACFSGGAGMGLAAAGKHHAAQLMAERFVALLDDQPESGRFYNRFRRDGSVVTKSAAGAWEKMYDLELPEQRPANYATVVLTLVWAGRANGERHYFAAAGRYADLVYSHKLNPAEFGRATKFGWAMVQLYEDTGKAHLLERAQRLGDVLVREQSDDGLWDPRPCGQGSASPWERLSYSSDCAMTLCALASQPQV